MIIGITCSRKNSQHNSSLRGMMTSILHEGMPMIFYSQILTWGQSTCNTTILLVSVTSYYTITLYPSIYE